MRLQNVEILTGRLKKECIVSAFIRRLAADAVKLNDLCLIPISEFCYIDFIK